ncbi:MAG: PorT family protein, partial [Muribaculaceae bacterium]|nr:PorT family protein [Muribaculaceae bacterium]
MKRLLYIIMFCLGAVSAANAQRFNDKVLNRPYADMRPWHLGFSIGFHTQDLNFTHNGFITEQGEQWFMEQPSFQPGFSVNGLVDFRLSTYFNVRFSPGLYYGSRDVQFREQNSETILKQSLKSTYLVFPVDLKYSAMRLHNARPYLTVGVMPTVNLTRKANEYLRLKGGDIYLTAGFGCDFYMPFFKFIPEVKFCFGLTDVIDHKRPDLVDAP